MKTICFYFQIHQPFRLKRYRFFDIGADHYYYDDYSNESIVTRIAEQSYIPAILALKEMIETSEGRFKAAFSISGTALDQLEMYVPEFIDHLRDLVKTGNVEILGETYAHSLASMIDEQEFKLQVERHSKKIQSLFGAKPKVFRNTELIYSDDIGNLVADMGYKGMVVEGAKHILGWKSPNYIYSSAVNPNLKLLMRNFKLSDDISFRFTDYSWSEYPLTVDKFFSWINSAPKEEKVISLFLSFDTFGGIQPGYSGIFEFLKAIPQMAPLYEINFATPSEIFAKNKPVDTVNAPYPFSWTGEDRGTGAWLGNHLQQEAFNHLYKIAERVHMVSDRRLLSDWQYLQSSDHFFYMSSRSFLSPYETQYEAFTNYMNVLSDFIRRVNEQFPTGIENEELNSLLITIKNQAKEIEVLKSELSSSVPSKAIESVEKKPKTVRATKKSTTKTDASESSATKKSTTRK